MLNSVGPIPGPIPTPALSSVGADELRGELGRLSFRGRGGGGICVDARRSEVVVELEGAMVAGPAIVAELEGRGVRGERGMELMSGAMGVGWVQVRWFHRCMAQGMWL
jgi:hypothetical protein